MTPDEAYLWALEHVERNDDGGFDEKRLADLVAECLDFDAESARLAAAKRVIDRRKRPGSTPADGQLAFEGMEPFAYEPQRLVANDAGQAIEHAKARPDYVSAAARRAQTNAERAVRNAGRWQRKASTYADWAMDQLRRRRRGSEITFDTFVREAGVWRDGDAPPEEGPPE